MATALSLDTYRLLGRSGLRVSPLSLGTMTFGTDWGWGSDETEARRIFDAYVDRGGNFIDTANAYTSGTSERFVGAFARERRDRLVIATKYTMSLEPDNPNAGGNHRRSMVRSVEASLKRLGTDFIDLLYLHAWDFTTQPEEILRAMDDLVRAGKLVSRMQAIADLRGWSPLVALQIEYSLIERTVERDLIPMARELQLGVIPWSPLESGVLSGKYSRADLGAGAGEADPVGTRKNVALSNASLSERGMVIANVVKEIAGEIGCTPAQAALAWTLLDPAVTSTIIGARTQAQLDDNLGALSVVFTDDQKVRLDQASAIARGFPHEFLERPLTRSVMFGTAKIVARR